MSEGDGQSPAERLWCWFRGIMWVVLSVIRSHDLVYMGF